VAGLNGELVFEGEAAGERRRRREGSSGRNGEHAAGGPYGCGSSHVGLLSGVPALAGRYPGSDVKHRNPAATRGAPWTWPRA